MSTINFKDRLQSFRQTKVAEVKYLDEVWYVRASNDKLESLSRIRAQEYAARIIKELPGNLKQMPADSFMAAALTAGMKTSLMKGEVKSGDIELKQPANMFEQESERLKLSCQGTASVAVCICNEDGSPAYEGDENFFDLMALLREDSELLKALFNKLKEITPKEAVTEDESNPTS